jgi:hypothetical protein
MMKKMPYQPRHPKTPKTRQNRQLSPEERTVEMLRQIAFVMKMTQLVRDEIEADLEAEEPMSV